MDDICTDVDKSREQGYQNIISNRGARAARQFQRNKLIAEGKINSENEIENGNGNEDGNGKDEGECEDEGEGQREGESVHESVKELVELEGEADKIARR